MANRLIRLTQEHEIKPFDCGDEDLNDFLLNSSKQYLEQLLAVTYIFEDDKNSLAFYSLLNDRISIDQVEDKSVWNRFRKKLPNAKRTSSYPAMKIGRFGINCEHQKLGIGSDLINFLKSWFITNNRTGCRYLTVDAYIQSLAFYEKCGFNYLTEKDKKQDTRLMYFDLMPIS